MTKEITKSFILQEIQDKFKLREFEPEVFSFGERVVPIYNIETHLQKWETAFKVVSITSATSFLFFSVPQNEQWLLRAFNVIFLSSGAHEVTGVLIHRAGGNIYVDMIAGRTVSYAFNCPTLIKLHPGDTINILVDTYVSTANLRLDIDFQKEEIR